MHTAYYATVVHAESCSLHESLQWIGSSPTVARSDLRQGAKLSEGYVCIALLRHSGRNRIKIGDFDTSGHWLTFNCAATSTSCRMSRSACFKTLKYVRTRNRSDLFVKTHPARHCQSRRLKQNQHQHLTSQTLTTHTFDSGRDVCDFFHRFFDASFRWFGLLNITVHGLCQKTRWLFAFLHTG